MVNILFKKFHPNTVLPTQGTKEAACVDVVATEVILGGNVVIVKLGFGTDIPKGYKGVIVPRSSFTHKGWVLQNSPAQIDSDYRGEWMLKFEAIPVATTPTPVGSRLQYTPFPYGKGDRVAQIFFEKVIEFTFEEVEELETSERGSGGFGSTGK